jgi:DNA-binding transcriptional regulator YhcF (GntR family)
MSFLPYLGPKLLAFLESECGKSYRNIKTLKFTYTERKNFMFITDQMEDYKVSLISKMVMSTAVDLMLNDSYKEKLFSCSNN